MMISALMAGASVALPLIVVPIRKSLGLPTYQWDGDAKTNPVRRAILAVARVRGRTGGYALAAMSTFGDDGKSSPTDSPGTVLAIISPASTMLAFWLAG